MWIVRSLYKPLYKGYGSHQSDKIWEIHCQANHVHYKPQIHPESVHISACWGGWKINDGYVINLFITPSTRGFWSQGSNEEKGGYNYKLQLQIDHGEHKNLPENHPTVPPVSAAISSPLHQINPNVIPEAHALNPNIPKIVPLDSALVPYQPQVMTSDNSDDTNFNLMKIFRIRCTLWWSTDASSHPNWKEQHQFHLENSYHEEKFTQTSTTDDHLHQLHLWHHWNIKYSYSQAVKCWQNKNLIVKFNAKEVYYKIKILSKIFIKFQLQKFTVLPMFQVLYFYNKFFNFNTNYFY